MKLIKHFVMGATLAAAAATACAQSTPAGDDALYQALGGQPGLTRLMDDLAVRLLADPRMNPFFKEIDMVRLKQQLVVQLCNVAGGPCSFDPKEMKKRHSGIDVRKGDFNALVEVLQQSMDAQGIAFGTQNQLLARLAPQHREIINVQ